MDAHYALRNMVAAVGLFIYADYKMKEYKFIEVGRFHLTNTAKAVIDRERKDYQPKNMVAMITGVIICILAPVTFMTV